MGCRSNEMLLHIIAWPFCPLDSEIAHVCRQAEDIEIPRHVKNVLNINS